MLRENYAGNEHESTPYWSCSYVVSSNFPTLERLAVTSAISKVSWDEFVTLAVSVM